jgi:hypothetical protein
MTRPTRDESGSKSSQQRICYWGLGKDPKEIKMAIDGYNRSCNEERDEMQSKDKLLYVVFRYDPGPGLRMI